jgi:hypothetical protein
MTEELKIAGRWSLNEWSSLKINLWGFLFSFLIWVGTTLFVKNRILGEASGMIIAVTLMLCALFGFAASILSFLTILVKKQSGFWKPLAGMLLSFVNFALGIVIFVATEVGSAHLGN